MLAIYFGETQNSLVIFIFQKIVLIKLRLGDLGSQIKLSMIQNWIPSKIDQYSFKLMDFDPFSIDYYPFSNNFRKFQSEFE